MHILDDMRILIDIDDGMAKSLERFASAKSRERSKFIRAAIAQALIEREEQLTEEAYRRHPDRECDAILIPDAWDSPWDADAPPVGAHGPR